MDVLFVAGLTVDPVALFYAGVKPSNQGVPGIPSPIVAGIEGKLCDRIITAGGKQDQADRGGVL